MTYWQAVRYCIAQKYASGQGRASPGEFWAYFSAFILFCLFWLLFIAGIMDYYEDINLLDFVLMYVPFVFVPPLVAVCIRRLHDTGKSGWVALLFLVPFINILALGLMLMRGYPGPNRFGPAPAPARF